MELLEDREGVARVLQDSLALQVVNRVVREGNPRVRVVELDELDAIPLGPVQRDAPTGELQSPPGNVHSDHLVGVRVDQEADYVVAWPASVVQNDFSVMIAPQPRELSEEGMLLEPPFEIAPRLARVWKLGVTVCRSSLSTRVGSSDP